MILEDLNLLALDYLFLNSRFGDQPDSLINPFEGKKVVLLIVSLPLSELILIFQLIIAMTLLIVHTLI